MSARSAVILGAWLTLFAGSQAMADSADSLPLGAEAAAVMNGIDAQRIRAHVRFLADDLLEGRGPGTRGGDLATAYIASQFEQYGLKPAGDDGGYLQRVDFVGVKTQPGTTLSVSTVSARPQGGGALNLTLGEDFVTNNQRQSERVDIDAPVVFVGYGIVAPEYHWNDYKGVDVKGKVVLIVVNEPPSTDPKFFNGEALTYYGRWTYKFEEAARQGAVGALIIHRTDLAAYGWQVVQSSWSNEQVYLADDHEPKLEAASWIQLDVAKQLFAAANLKVDDMIHAAGVRGFRARPLPLRVTAHLESRVRKFVSYNVLGVWPGEDASKQDVFYSAHYDHLGIDPAKSGDNIYNGAVDNGTGCGMLLELAHAFTSVKRPPHSVYFAAVTAEEKGLLGSNYLGKHLPVPQSDISLDLNFDAVDPVGLPQSVTVAGAERTTFYPTVEKTAAAFGYRIEPEAEPGAGHYYRSDHFSLARAGVPAFSVGTALDFVGHPPEWGKARREDYTAHRYHQPSDEFRADMDFSTNAALARFGFALGWQALTAAQSVQWLPGDEFEKARRAAAPVR